MVAAFRSPRFSLGCCVLVSFALAYPLHAREIHVPSDYPSIQQGLDAALPGDLILVAPGTYAGPLNTNLDFQGNDIELRSEAGADATVIDCQHQVRGLDFHRGETGAAILDGFTILRGNPNGIRCSNGSSPTIRNCTLSLSLASAMKCNDSSPTVESCTFADNPEVFSTYGAGIYCSGSSLTVSNSIFARNNACCTCAGGGILAQSSSLVIAGCTFMDNVADSGAGIDCSMGSSLMIRDSHFRNNISKYGGSGIVCSHDSPSVTVAGCTFLGNVGGDLILPGIGLTSRAPATITNCTFVGNGPGAQLSAAGGSVIERTIIAFSTGMSVACSGGVPTLRCCDVFGNQGGDWDCVGQQYGEGNFSADPLFCNPGDITLNGDSPCLPGNHPEGEDCGLIGAYGLGCGVTPVQTATWGQIKAAFDR